DENRPRMDPEENINIVTDSRLKRTIRDYLDSQGEEIFIKEMKREDGTLKSRARLLSEYLTEHSGEFPNWELENLKEVKEKSDNQLWNLLAEVSAKKLKDALLDTFLDLRLFGATIAVKKKTITQIGPVQFKLGRSLHQVKPQLIKGTTVMPSRAGVEAGTITETWVLPYSLIGFYGIVNENTGKETGLTEEDLDLLMEGMWNGTKDLITRSKVGQIPRFLLRVVYSEGNYHIG
ncbi:MAG: type I-B CRISPR-associated protein Cas7/Csh2, partial [Candidatus Korarchaeota archaeon]|nr:type I-B CRISPR-associated protein Cas7/Csh2 [Candidatus Korarchaeota archaeon]NIU84592.1 type I-B CRISPR-associated protein Cas7/Csh2 [Candidatus Thorarchaeota archaeon]NIW14653.1 type I-B CRISPR-associated protein Cas7/Csh2 [Candidatus Thorarchaeota archaeon]NIW52983.1 type I-B CRISPR-associated protein Cas7/Csh2 [Candidatus Korarchaeota archaeon]